MNTELGNFNEKVEELMAYVESLQTSGYWVGSVYDAFLANIRLYKSTKIDNLVQELTGWVNSLEQAGADADANTNAGLNIVG